jgi:2',3'-cyclic-nucleotide 2'-phosphodiesterase (5'-nucleotidase family)
MKKTVKYFRNLLLILLFFAVLPCAYGNPTEIRILHVNDSHGFAEPYQPLGSREPLGGIAYLALKANQLRREKPTLLLAAGDMIQGNNWANLSRGKSVVEIMNRMRFDVMVVGNHEFDFGQEALVKRISEASFPVLGANVKGVGGLEGYVIKELEGIKIAIIGVVTEDVPVSTSPKNVSGLQFVPVHETVQKYVTELKGKVDLILVLSHIGYYWDRRLAETVRGIDVIVGGHSHTKLDKPVQIGDTLIVQAWEHAKVLGVLDLTVQDKRVREWDGHLEEISPRLGAEDPEVKAFVEEHSREVERLMGARIGETEVDLDGENVRKRETNLGDLVADIIREASGADLAIINGGGIRTSIKKGEIRIMDIYSVLPFDNYVVAIKLTGRQIREALEHGVSGVEENEGRFPQVSGITFTYSPSAPKGSRVKEIRVQGRPVDPDGQYRVATNDFMAAGGDGYRAFGEAMRSSKDFEVVGGMMKGEKVAYSDAGRWIRDVVIEYLREKKIAPRVEGRIVEVDGK